ncbi:hypothetical protein K32_42230 [Kaistia sp. 32K]|uniref:hypothetical protein n=1 Tax=Kaistia sp. 32K TaxID=2795690 RepID=UPI0019165529|nr:hypothetical protein [Kaistia sp. 32K]BCP55606.1 hypothetical protein K32_42230 [Kaistia sp. 32K]
MGMLKAAKAYFLREYPELRPMILTRQKAARWAIIENRKARTEGHPGARDLLNALGPAR